MPGMAVSMGMDQFGMGRGMPMGQPYGACSVLNTNFLEHDHYFHECLPYSFSGGNPSPMPMGMHPGLQSSFGQGGFQYDQGMSRFQPQQHGLPSQLQQQSRDEEFSIQNEDFPALPGSAPSAKPSHFQPQLVQQSPSQQQLQHPATISPMISEPAPGNYPVFPGLPMMNSSVLPTLPRQGPSATLVKDPRYGLLGLVDVVKMTDKDLAMLSLGQDLASFGLNLNSSDNLYASFSSPFSESSGAEPQYSVPPCYVNHAPSFKIENLVKIQIETLFYMFYSMPKDVMQAYAAQELYRRDWRYHTELKIWLKQRLPQELAQPGAVAVPFMFFDLKAWEQRPYTEVYRGNIVAGFLSEEEVRVRSSQVISAPAGTQVGAP